MSELFPCKWFKRRFTQEPSILREFDAWFEQAVKRNERVRLPYGTVVKRKGNRFVRSDDRFDGVVISGMVTYQEFVDDIRQGNGKPIT